MNLLLLPVQIILSIFLIFAISRVYLRFKEGTISMGGFLFWVGLWCVTLFSIYNPGFTTYWAQLLGVGRGADAIIYAAIIVLSYLIFRVNVMVENIREEISKIIREIALREKPQRIQKKKE